MRRLAAALLSALLAAAGMPAPGMAAAACSRAGSAPAAGPAAGIATAHRHGPGCKMSCCVVRPAAASSSACRCGRSQPRHAAGFAAGMPSILPAPPRLPLPRGAALAWRQPGLPPALPFLGVPERPPRA